MIFICVKWKVKPEYADQWVELTRDFTEATRAEDGQPVLRVVAQRR
jgi:quinol monooxygenase YgiN